MRPRGLILLSLLSLVLEACVPAEPERPVIRLADSVYTGAWSLDRRFRLADESVTHLQ